MDTNASTEARLANICIYFACSFNIGLDMMYKVGGSSYMGETHIGADQGVVLYARSPYMRVYMVNILSWTKSELVKH